MLRSLLFQKDGNTDCERILVVINFKGESRKNLASRVSQEQAKQTNKLLILNINFRDDISQRERKEECSLDALILIADSRISGGDTIHCGDVVWSNDSGLVVTCVMYGTLT